jgi:hypothetical protein
MRFSYLRKANKRRPLNTTPDMLLLKPPATAQEAENESDDNSHRQDGNSNHRCGNSVWGMEDMSWYYGRYNRLDCFRYGYRSRCARYQCAREKNNLSGSRERRCLEFIVIIFIMKKRVMGLEEVDLADAEQTVVRCVKREKKGTTHPEITDEGTEVIPVVALMVVVGAVMAVVPVSPRGAGAEVRGAETVGTPPYPKGVSVLGTVNVLPTELSIPVPGIKGLATALVAPLGIDVSTGPLFDAALIT